MSKKTSVVSQSISGNARIICGKGSDGNRGDLHRAIDVARQLFTLDKWDGQHDIIIHRPHDLHRELQFSGEPVVYPACNVHPAAHGLVEGEHYEIDDPEAAKMLAAACEAYPDTISIHRGRFSGSGHACYSILAEHDHENGAVPKEVAATINRRLKQDYNGYLGCTVSGYDKALEKWTTRTSFVVRAQKHHHISQVSDKRAVTIARELSTRNRYGHTDAYNVAIAGSARRMIAQGQPDAEYGHQNSGVTYWFPGGAEMATPVTYDQAKAALREGEHYERDM